MMAAGRGTRMDPLTRTRPKVLLPVAGRPLMEHTLRQAVAAGFKRATIIVHAGADQVREAFADFPLEVTFVEQGDPRGTGHAVAALEAHVEEDFVLASGDAYVDASDLRTLARGSPAVGTFEASDVRPYGALDVQHGKVQAILEKPAEARPGPVNTGTYCFPEEIIARCAKLEPSPRGELELTDAITGMAADGQPLAAVPVPSWKEAGRPWELLDLQAHLMQGMESRIDGTVGERVDIEGPLVVEAGAVVRNGTTIEGGAWIGAGAKVGPSTYIRGATSIGTGCHVGAGVELKNSILGDNTNVPHLSYVGDSILGSGCNLGAGSQVANLKHSPRPVRVLWKGMDWVDTGRRKLGIIAGDDVKTGVNCSMNPGTVLCPGARLPAGSAVSGWVEAEPL